jgi:hypothetical protein
MEDQKTRREFLKDVALLSAAVAGLRSTGAAGETAASKLPTIKLGKLEVSRLLLGSNPFFGFAHKPGDVGKTMKEFYTEERIMAVLDEAARQGITAVWTPCYDHWIRLWNKYQEKGGKLKIWIGQPDTAPEQMKDAITACAKNGGKAVCIQGEAVDRQFREGKHDVVRGWLEHIRSFGLPAGIASHRPETHLVAEEKKFPTDFYHQCMFQPEDYGEQHRENALATIRKLEKTVVAYKVLAAGRLPAKETFTYMFKHLRPKDGICVGVFPKDDPDQVATNATLVREISAKRDASAKQG